MASEYLEVPFLTADPPGRALSAVEARTALARREARPGDPEALADLAVAFGTSPGQIARALCAAIKARAEDWAKTGDRT